MSDPAPLRSVVVVGGGLVGLFAVLAVERALPGVSVTLIDQPPDSSALAERLPSLPPGADGLLALIGIEAKELFAHGLATPRLGVALVDWRRNGETWRQGFGRMGRPERGLPFHQMWLAGEARGLAQPFGHYAPAGRIEAARIDPRHPPPGLPVGLALDGKAVLRALRERCRARPIRWRSGPPVACERDASGLVTAVRLANGERVEGELWLDASGGGADLAAPGAEEDWRPLLPAGALELTTEAARAPRFWDEAIAVADGWCWVAPGPRVTTISRFGGTAGGGERLTLRPGRRSQAWRGNVVLLGDAACRVDPVHGLNLHLAWSGVRLLLAHLPDRRFAPENADEFNRRWSAACDRVRDFLALHHLLRGGRTPPAGLPDSLARAIGQFARRGRLPFEEEDELGSDAWIGAFLALGIRPTLSAAITAGLDERTLRVALRV